MRDDRRQPWANAPFIPGALADYMRVQFDFFGHDPRYQDLLRRVNLID